MDLFGSDDSDSSDTDTTDLLGAAISLHILTHCKRSQLHHTTLLPKVLVVSSSSSSSPPIDDPIDLAPLQQRLQPHVHLTIAPLDALPKDEYDAIVLPSLDIAHSFALVQPHTRLNLVPGGLLVQPATANPLILQQGWYPATTSSSPLLSTFRRTSISTNTSAGTHHVDPHQERVLLEQVVVHRSAKERESGAVLSVKAQAAAAQALRRHGLCIIPNYFPKAIIAQGGQSAVVDVQQTIERLEASPLNLKLTPSPPTDVNYAEYAAQDAQFVRGHDDKYTLTRGPRLTAYATEHAEAIRHNASIVQLLEDVVLPTVNLEEGREMSPSEKEERKTQTMLRRSSSLLESHAIGAVVALPGRGCTKDQTIHVDTEHVYEHVHLPPHYMVMFLPALSTTDELKEEVGQTAFVCGSHVSAVARGIAQGGKEAAQEGRWGLGSVVRPHCGAGDVVLFDARLLHFGIANGSHTVWRPLLFVNYTRPWFSDYQPGGEVIVRHR